MSLKPKHSSPATPRLRRALAFRLTAAYSLACLLMVILATASLYIVLRTELDRSTELFLADKLHVLRSMLRERPDDEDGLREEIELESAARRYQQFYIRLLDEHGVPIMTTPGMSEQLDLAELANRTHGHSERSIAMAGRNGKPFLVTSATVAVGTPATDSDTV
jgi:two-component system heavy metal sensor histidine kinase CusS